MRSARDDFSASPSRPALCFFCALALLSPAASGCSAEVRVKSAQAQRPRSPAAPPLATSPPVKALPPTNDAPEPDSEASRLFLTQSVRSGEARPSERGLPRVTALALANTARGEARGMLPQGEPLALAIGEGERGTVAVTIAPGECAAFIAQGGLGVIEVDLFLTTGAPPALEVLAQDTDVGPIAVIGGRGSCFGNRGRAPLAVDVHAQVRRGSGVVLVQGYRGPLPSGNIVPGP